MAALWSLTCAAAASFACAYLSSSRRCSQLRHCAAEMSGLRNFSVQVQSCSDEIESDPVLIRKIFENHQSDPVLIRQCKITYFYFASWGKRTILEIFCLHPNTIGWRQNSSSSAFASWSKIDTIFWHFQNF